MINHFIFVVFIFFHYLPECFDIQYYMTITLMEHVLFHDYIFIDQALIWTITIQSQSCRHKKFKRRVKVRGKGISSS